MEFIQGFMPYIKWFMPFVKLVTLIPFALMIYKHIRKYFDLRGSKSGGFTIGTKTNVGSTLYTTGRVVSISLRTVIIEGYQVNYPVTTHGIFTIRLHNISGINFHGSVS